ncbi:MAG: 50S ribosomal protein L13 [Oscillospiraceae bacterium]|jgi:large subunit ribosomal protein L13|nr:50S ribosomal protein L13 [Oscillospiraceae bacterium]
MSTYMPKKESISRVWYVLDAAGVPLGRLCAQVVLILRGKVRPIFAPHVDCGDFVVIKNCEKVLLTGKKRERKVRKYHTGYIGHVRTISYSKLMESSPERALNFAVKGMLPSTTLGRKQFTRLRVIKGEPVGFEAQKLEKWSYIKKMRTAN